MCRRLEREREREREREGGRERGGREGGGREEGREGRERRREGGREREIRIEQRERNIVYLLKRYLSGGTVGRPVCKPLAPGTSKLNVKKNRPCTEIASRNTYSDKHRAGR